MNNSWRWDRWSHLHHMRWGGRMILKKGYSTTPIFNDQRTSVCEMIK
jgi:hypothetical protein